MTRPGTCPARHRRTRADRTGRSPSTSATSRPGRSSRSTTPRPRSRPDAGRPTTTTTAATSIGSTSGCASRGHPSRATRRSLGWRPPGTGSSRRPRPLSPTAIREDAAWGWVYMTLHGHYLDHLAVIEPWAATLRARQADGDPFVADPRAVDHAAFAAQDAAAAADLDALLRNLPLDRWVVGEVTPGWTVRDHVAHLADWAEEGVRAIEVFRRDGEWLADPDEGIDAWNERMVEAARRRIARIDARALRARPAGVARGRRHHRHRGAPFARTAGAGPTTACTATSASMRRCWARGARPRAGRTRGADAGIIERGPDRTHDRGHRRGGGAARVPPAPA